MKYFLAMLLLTTGTIVRADFDETIITPPIKDSNELSLSPISCITRSHLNWDVCFSLINDETKIMNSIRVENNGDNPTVPNAGFGIGRTFEFMFEDLARSDLGLLIWDMPDERESHGHLKMMMFFPRKNLFAARFSGENENKKVFITLPTGEEIIFRGTTKEIIGGVLKEFPMDQDHEGNALEPKFEYTGSGVMVTAHRLNDYPVGVSKTNQQNQKASIFKKGKKVCTVNASDLWYTDKAKGGNVFFNKSYVTDQAFDQYVIKHCKFSIY